MFLDSFFSVVRSRQYNLVNNDRVIGLCTCILYGDM